MVCVVELNKEIRFNFAQNNLKQKIWICMILDYTKIDINHLAAIIEVCPVFLEKVSLGKDYLDPDWADHLAELFLITFSD